MDCHFSPGFWPYRKFRVRLILAGRFSYRQFIPAPVFKHFSHTGNSYRLSFSVTGKCSHIAHIVHTGHIAPRGRYGVHIAHIALTSEFPGPMGRFGAPLPVNPGKQHKYATRKHKALSTGRQPEADETNALATPRGSSSHHRIKLREP